jgi:hypothetical protein
VSKTERHRRSIADCLLYHLVVVGDESSVGRGDRGRDRLGRPGAQDRGDLERDGSGSRVRVDPAAPAVGRPFQRLRARAGLGFPSVSEPCQLTDEEKIERGSQVPILSMRATLSSPGTSGHRRSGLLMSPTCPTRWIRSSRPRQRSGCPHRSRIRHARSRCASTGRLRGFRPISTCRWVGRCPARAGLEQ